MKIDEDKGEKWLCCVSDPKTTFLAAADYDRHAVDESMSAVGSLRRNVENLEVAATPLREVLGSGGIKAWIARWVLGLR